MVRTIFMLAFALGLVSAVPSFGDSCRNEGSSCCGNQCEEGKKGCPCKHKCKAKKCKCTGCACKDSEGVCECKECKCEECGCCKDGKCKPKSAESELEEEDLDLGQ